MTYQEVLTRYNPKIAEDLDKFLASYGTNTDQVSWKLVAGLNGIVTFDLTIFSDRTLPEKNVSELDEYEFTICGYDDSHITITDDTDHDIERILGLRLDGLVDKFIKKLVMDHPELRNSIRLYISPSVGSLDGYEIFYRFDQSAIDLLPKYSVKRFLELVSSYNGYRNTNLKLKR